MAKTLVLLTKTFPFGIGEQYLHAEIPYLSEAFDKVYIYPHDYFDKNNSYTVKLPLNVEVIHLNASFGSVKGFDLLFLLSILFDEIFHSKDRYWLFKNLKWNLIQLWTQIKLSRHVSDFLNKFNKNQLVFYSYWFHKSALLLSVLTKRKQINGYYSRAHSVDLYHHLWPLLNDTLKVPPFQYFKIKEVKRLFCISEHGKQVINNLYPEFMHKTTVNYLGVDIEIENINRPSISESVFTIVTCSGLDYNKRIHLLSDALLQINRPFTWVHFGDGPFLEYITNNINSFAEGCNFIYKGKTDHKKIIDFYKLNKVHLFINLSRVEGVPVSIMEAMSFGVPIIATEINGTPEAVINDFNGILLSVNFTITQLVEAIREVMDNQDRQKYFAENSFKLAVERFNASINCTRLINELNN